MHERTKADLKGLLIYAVYDRNGFQLGHYAGRTKDEVEAAVHKEFKTTELFLSRSPRIAIIADEVRIVGRDTGEE